MRKAIETTIITAVATVFLAGCALFSKPYHGTKYYDLGTPGYLPGATVGVDSVTMEGAYKRKMAYRLDDNELTFDDYNSWASAPEQMLERYLTMSLSDVEAKNKAKLTLSILSFELDMKKKEAVLTVEYKLKSKDKTLRRRPTIRTKLKSDTPAGFAAAMAENAKILATEIVAQKPAN